MLKEQLKTLEEILWEKLSYTTDVNEINIILDSLLKLKELTE